MSAKKRTKSSNPSPRANAVAGRSGRNPERTEPRRDDDEIHSEADADERSKSGVRVSPRATGRKRKRSSTPRPPQLETVFSPVEIDFFERAADMYAEEYDVWEDFRRAELN